MNAPLIVPIETPMTIYHAAELKEVLLEALERAACVHFDLSAVPEIDCAGLQLIVAARRSAADRRQSCEFVAASENVQATLTLLGQAQSITVPVLTDATTDASAPAPVIAETDPACAEAVS